MLKRNSFIAACEEVFMNMSLKGRIHGNMTTYKYRDGAVLI